MGDERDEAVNPREKRVFRGDLSGVDKARLHVKALAGRHHLSEELAFQIELALVEVWTNIVRHAYAGRKGDFQLVSWREAERLYFEVRDEGPPFDPRDFKEPDLERHSNESGQGGFGCFLINRLMDGVEYRREDGKNILTLWKKVPDAEPPVS